MNEYSEKFLNKIVSVNIDRPMSSRHPKHGFFYPINYGFVPNTIAPDGEELDVYVLGVFEPIKNFEGKCVAIIKRIDDNDDKLIVVPKDKNYSDEQIEALVEFQERFFSSTIIREKNKCKSIKIA